MSIKLEQYVAFSIIVIILYTIAEFISGCFAFNHDTLTVAVYGFFGGEIVSCALIKIFKLRSNDDNSGIDIS